MIDESTPRRAKFEWHASRTLVLKVWEVNSANYRHAHRTPEVELVPLPAGAQFLNVIESKRAGLEI